MEEGICIKTMSKRPVRMKPVGMTREEFIARGKHYLQNYDYDYSNIEYIDKDTQVQVKCAKHGVFTVNPMRHLRDLKALLL